MSLLNLFQTAFKTSGSLTKHRQFSTNIVLNDIEKSSSENVTPKVNTGAYRSEIAGTDFDRRILVWMGKYKSLDEIPKRVPVDMLQNTKTRLRIRICNIMIVATACACLFFVLSGKRARDRGESVTQMNLDWHKDYNEKARLKAEGVQTK